MTIRSALPSGPRYDDQYPSASLHKYENRILLCKEHHKLVDDNPDVFAAEDLDRMKQRHERRVAKLTDASTTNGWIDLPGLEQIANGTQLVSMVTQSMAWVLSHDHPDSNGEAQEIGHLFNEIRDLGDIWQDVEPGWLVTTATNFQQQMDTLAMIGYELVGGCGSYNIGVDRPVTALALRARKLPGTPIS